MKTHDHQFKKSVSRALYIPTMLILTLWLIKGFEFISGLSLVPFGIYPLKTEALPGVLLAPLIHADLGHLFNNTFSLLVLTTTLFYFYRPIAFKVFILVWLVTGLCVWLGGRKAYHIGASGVVYGIASFLFFSGILRKNIKLLAISLMVIFMYGGLIWGIFPIFPEMSWESHLFGGVTGLIFAFIYSDEGPQKEPAPIEDDPDDEYPYWLTDDADAEMQNKEDPEHKNRNNKDIL